MFRVATLLALLLVLLAGCERPEAGPPNMMPEILGALQITDSQERDTALAQACRHAAEQGSAPAVMMGLPRIDNVTLRDTVAADCAEVLNEAGQSAAAEDVARLISDETKRNAALAEVGAGGD
ncbi:MAG: hypothetical protein JSS02_13225 [Planctomycetes bacterium]|nr:hypothetical protein [Planctomycetota bacterium]